MRLWLVSVLSAACLFAADAPPLAKVSGGYTATAYCQKGKTASGDYVHRHVVAADPDILPIGSRVKIRRAGRYSGEYVVADTGEKIQGRRLDIYIPNPRDCKKFGRKSVRVEVLEIGDGTHQTTLQSDVKVKEDVKQDLSKNTVGNAATETDWAVKHAEEKKGVPPPVATEKAAQAAAPAASTDAAKNAAAPRTEPQ